MESSENTKEFSWKPEYDHLLEQLATSDYVETDWNELRHIILYKLKENIATFIANPPPPTPAFSQPVLPIPSEEQPLSSPESSTTVAVSSPKPPTGAKFPPFPRREVSEIVRKEFNSFGQSKSRLTADEAKEMIDAIELLLQDFSGPPFTIQRVCELVWKPQTHYKHTGKYLRAVERALLVTSTAPEFPVIPPESKDVFDSPFSPAGSLREARTPLFSPIPFLHEDARRSRSRSRSHSPPMSPLQLASSASSVMPEDLHLSDVTAAMTVNGEGIIDGPVIGLVDELDDPGPGHMSERPTALTSVTTTAPEPTEATASVKSDTKDDAQNVKTGLAGSLEDRFVRAEENNAGEEGTDLESPMAVEPDEDKENVPKP